MSESGANGEVRVERLSKEDGVGDRGRETEREESVLWNVERSLEETGKQVFRIKKEKTEMEAGSGEGEGKTESKREGKQTNESQRP